MIDIKTNADGLSFKVLVQPKSTRNQIVGQHGDALKMKITAPPVDGAANNMCIQFLARQLSLPKSRLEIVSGQNSRTKRILIKAVPREQSALKKKIHSLLSIK